MELNEKLLKIKELRNIPDVYSTCNEDNPIAYLKFSLLFGRGEWYVTEMEKTSDGDVEMFGYVVSPLGEDCDEWGTFHFSVLRTIRALIDVEFKPTPINKVIK